MLTYERLGVSSRAPKSSAGSDESTQEEMIPSAVSSASWACVSWTVAVSRDCERQSLIVTTNLPFESWTEVLCSERLTGAMLDRLTHRVHLLGAKGESDRLAESRRRLKSRRKPAVANGQAAGTKRLTRRTVRCRHMLGVAILLRHRQQFDFVARRPSVKETTL